MCEIVQTHSENEARHCATGNLHELHGTIDHSLSKGYLVMLTIITVTLFNLVFMQNPEFL